MRKAATAVLALAMVFCAGVSFAADLDALGKKDHSTGAEITDRRFAVIIVKQDETLYFNDISTAMKWRAGACIATKTVCDAQSWAYDYFTAEKFPIRAGYFVISPGVKTPRGSGIAALRSDEGAKRLMGELGGKGPLDYEQLSERY